MVIGWNIEKKRKKDRKKSLLEELALTDGGMVWWVARKGEQVNNNTARCEFCSQNQAAIIM